MIASATASQAGQLPPATFLTYDALAASSIVAGPFALYLAPVNSILPTQLNLGFTEVGKKVTAYDLENPSQLASDLQASIEPVVIGPGGKLYLTNGHHTFASLLESVYGPSNPNVYLNVIANYSNLTFAQFLAQMQASNYLLPLDNGVVKPIDPQTGAPIPTALTSLTSDPYRGLEYSILKNKNSVLFPTTSNISGAAGSTKPGLDKNAAFYADFISANAYRYANNGLGLPYLSPGDIQLATQWNLTGTNQTTLTKGGAAVTVAQLPGYILPSSLNISGVIDTATVTNGVLDGNGTFNGVRGLNLGTVTIGTPSSTTGFILQLGADLGGIVTLSGANTYAGGTTILAGTLSISSDANLGAASPSSPIISATNAANDIRAANGVVFNSLSEGAGTLQINSSMSFNRPIGVGGETAIINPNGNTVTLTGPIVSLDTNAIGVPDLTIAKSGGGTVILAPTSGSNSSFYGNLIVSGGTLQASSDAALGNTTGPSTTIGQIVLDGGTFKAGASFNSVRSLSLTGGSIFDTNGFTTSFSGEVTDVQRTLTVANTAGAAGAVTFGSLNISGANTTSATGSTSILALLGGAGGVTVSLTNGVTRTDRSTLFIAPTNAAGNTTLGVTEKVLSGVAPTLTNGIVNPTTIIDQGNLFVGNGAAAGNNRFNFATYDPTNGYKTAIYTKTGSGAAGIRASTSVDIVEQTGNSTLAANAAAYALKVDSGAVITATGFTLTLGNGTSPAGLILSGSSAGITGGTLAFGGSEASVIVRGTTIVSSTLTGTNGLTLSGTGTLTLSSVSAGLTGPVNIDSGTLNLTAANALPNVSSVDLSNVKSSPSAAFLSISASNTFSSLNSAGSNSTVSLSNGAALTIGDTTNNFNSTLASTITETGIAVAGALTKNGSGMLDLTGVSSGKLTLVTGSTVVVNGGQLRISANAFVNPNTIVLNGASELQLAEGGGSILSNAVSGSGAVHLIGGTLKVTSTSNSYSGGTIVEQGSSFVVTTANVSSGNANIINAGGLVVFDQTTTGAYAGTISDGCQFGTSCGTKLSGSLVKDDSTGGNTGNVTLGAVQTYTGGTFVEAGTLTLGVADAIATSSGVDLGRIGGGATATLVLSANNMIRGLMDETANTTTVQLNAGNLTLNTANGTAFSYGGTITGSGGLIKAGGGTEILTGANNYTGGTTISGGTLQIGNGSATGSIVGNVIDNGTLVFNRSDVATFGGAISGSGAVIQIGAGTTTLTAMNSYNGPTTVSAGTLTVAAGGGITSNVTNNANFINAGTVTGSLNNAGVASNGATITGAVANAGTFTNGTGGSINGGATVTGGTLTTTGTIAGGVTNSATVNANGGAVNGAIANNIGGVFNVGGVVTSSSTFGNAAGAGLAVLGAGSYTIGGLLTNAGAVTVANGGVLVATAGGITNTATGAISVASGGTIRDDLNNAGTVINNGAYIANVASNTGAGNITNGTSGTWTGNVLSNAAAIANLGQWTGSITTSGTFINSAGGIVSGLVTNSGTLNNAGALNGGLANTAGTAVNTGSIAGLVTITGGTLTGGGSIANLNVSGGVFAPGSGVVGSSTIVAGNLAFASAATYLVQINSTTSSFASVSGTATLSGASVGAVYTNGSYVATRYTILSAGSIAGLFSGLVNTNLPSNFSTSLGYDATHAYLDLTLNYAKVAGLNQNQQNVGNALSGFFTRTGGIPLAFGSLSPAGLTLVSGEAAVGSQQTTFDAMTLFMGLLTDPLNAGRGGAGATGPLAFAEDSLAYAANGKRKPTASEREAYAAIYRKASPMAVDSFGQRWSIWSAGYGGSQTTDGNATLGSNSTTSRFYGSALGIDYRLSSNTLAGIALAGGGTNFSVANSGTGRSDLFQAGAFLRHTIGATYLTAALAYGWQDVTTDRSVGADRLRANFKADAFSGRVEAGHRIATPLMGITPYAAGQFTAYYLPGYGETVAAGINTFALNYAAKDVTASRSELGLRSDKSFALNDSTLTLRGRAAWAHNFNPDRSIAATFQTLPGASFVVNGAAQASDAALVTASAEMTWRNNWSAAATFEGEFSNVTSSYAGKGVVRYAW